MRNIGILRRQIRLPLLLLMSAALLLAQGKAVHVHAVDQPHEHPSLQQVSGHSHQSIAHLADDFSHPEHHHGVIAENDFAQTGLLSKVPGNSWLPALPASVVILFVLMLFQAPSLRRRIIKGPLLPPRYLSPLLRAPPSR